MNFIPTPIPDIFIIEPRVFEDTRGFFFESYNRDLFSKHGIKDTFIQDNHSRSDKGVLRGLHYQAEPHAQAKLVRVLKGRVLDVAVDIRRASPTFGKHVAVELSAENKKMLYVPKGFAHGFCVLENGTEFFYKVSDIYSPADERGIRYDDPALQIEWPKMKFILSEKDKKNPPFAKAELF